MTTVTQHDTHEPTGDADIGAGQLLRDARLAKGLGITDVAASLRLEVRAVNNLEADAFDKLPGPTFVRGYLRSYARLLDIPAGPVLEAYERCQFTPPPLVADIANRAETRSGDFPVRLVTYSIVIVLAGLVILWWQNQRTLSSSPTEDVAAERTISEPNASGSSSVIKHELSTEDEATEPPPAVETPTRIPEENEPTEEPSIVDDETLDAPQQTLISGIAPVARASTLDATPIKLTLPQSPAGNGDAGDGGAIPIASMEGMRSSRSSAFSPPPVAPTMEPEKRLRMEFKHESWVEVYGGDDERLYYDLARAGDIVELDGSVPIRVLLGYAKDVVIEYEGSPFDYSNFLTRNMARFTLGVHDTQTTDETNLGRSSSVADNNSRSDSGTTTPAEKFSRH